MIKQLLFIMLLLLPASVLAQSKIANQLYKQGERLYDDDKPEEALQCFLKCDSLDKATLKPSSKKCHRSELYINNCYSEIIEKQSDSGNDAEVVRLAKKLFQYAKATFGEEHPLYLNAINELAISYWSIGDLHTAIKLATECAELVKKLIGEETEEYCSVLNNLAAFNTEVKNYDESIKLGTLAMNLRKKISGEESTEYALSAHNLGCYYSFIGNYEESARLNQIALPILKKTLGESHPYYALALNYLMQAYERENNFSEAIRYGEEALDIVTKYYGTNHGHYFVCAINLANLYLKSGEYDKGLQGVESLYKKIESFILKNFACLTSRERYDYWNMYNMFFGSEITSFAFKYPSPKFAQLSFNSQLFTKSLLLNSEIELQNLIEESGDTALVNRYHKIQQKRAMLDNLNQQIITEREMDADSLQAVIEEEELSLIQSSKSLGDYTKNLSISWLDVQKKLKDNDIAIEFTCVEDDEKKLVYLAHILKKDMTSPEIVSLFSADTLLNFSINDLYSSPKLYNVLWKPLEKYFQGVKNVYFSPCAKLHTIGIEYLPDDEAKVFCEKYAAYRLSSTRELAVAHVINSNRKAATYGGIRYNNDSESGDDRGGVASYLVGTKVESDSVAKLLRSANYDVTVFNDVTATEESLKHLSGSGLSILHIGTHGFYFTESEMEEMGLNLLVNKGQNGEDRSLSCSGLLFAGANSAFVPELRQSIPEGVGDGILTAKEISRLDFKGLDLVVLSACQSGLGEVTGEGVFGLQRGFKKAGARTLVMSLWNVSDEATQLLMTEFFKNFTSGMTKREAFVSAQKVVRQKFPHPGLWAAFVMVDGI